MTDHIEITDTEVFRPRYDSLSEDNWRLMAHITELYHQDRLGKVFSALADMRELAAKRLKDAYFAQGLYAEIEAAQTFLGEVDSHDAAWEEELRDTLDRFIAAGQGQHVIRIWRKLILATKMRYWYFIKQRDDGFAPLDLPMNSVASQRAEYDAIVARVPEFKTALFDLIEKARADFRKVGATQAQFVRLDDERDEIAAEKRNRPKGKPDPRKMDMDVFWEVIGQAGEDGVVAQIDTLPDRLCRFKPSAVRAFDALLHEMDARAYHSEIWALAYLLQGGASDDSFAAFRCWLILQGRDRFERTLAAPDAFDISLFDDTAESCIALWDAPLAAYALREAKPMKRKAFKMPDLAGPDLAEEDFANALPRIAAQLAG